MIMLACFLTCIVLLVSLVVCMIGDLVNESFLGASFLVVGIATIGFAIATIWSFLV